MGILLSTFPNLVEGTTGADRLRFAYELLKDLSEDELCAGVKKFCLKHKEIYPNTNFIAYIREYAKEGTFMPDYEAWDFVLKEVKDSYRTGYNAVSGTTKKPDFQDHKIDMAIRTIGWDVVCERNDETGIRNQFMDVYNKMCKRELEG